MNWIKTTIAAITAAATIAFAVVGFDVAVDNAPDSVQEAVGAVVADVGTEEAEAHAYTVVLASVNVGGGMRCVYYKSYSSNHTVITYWHRCYT